MAALESHISLVDGMSDTLVRISNATGDMVEKFDSVDKAIDKGFDEVPVKNITTAIDRANLKIADTEEFIKRAERERCLRRKSAFCDA